MEAKAGFAFIFCLSIWCGVLSFVNADETETLDICRLFPDKTKIRDPNSFNKYITCNNFTSTYTTCATKTPFYDKDSEKCVAELDVEDLSIGLTCANSTEEFIPDPASCKGYYYCLNEQEAIFGLCQEGTHFNPITQSCIWKESSDCHADQFQYCQIVKDKVNIKDEARCDQYYTCSKGTLKSEACSSKYYNAATGKCVDKALVECKNHPVPANACGTKNKPKKNEFVSDEVSCQGYLYCAETPDGTPDQDPFRSQCPTDKFFKAINSGECVDPIEVKCDFDRCEGRTLTFVSSGKKGCRHYLRCKDGATLEELTCGNRFFDEKIGACVDTVISYESCLK